MWHRDRSNRSALDKLLTNAPAAPQSNPTPRLDSTPVPAEPVPAPTAAPAVRPAEAPAAIPLAKTSVLGPTLRFKGDLCADEDLVVQGHIEGSILHTRTITIGQDGSMQGDIRARRVVVEGRVEGDLYALEAVGVRATADVFGSIYAPRVGVAEGAIFNGDIDMKNAPAVPEVAGTTSAPAGEHEMTSSQIDAVLTASTGTDF